MCTGMRWANRTEVKIANAGKPALARDDVGHHDAAGYAVDVPV
jgi:hypothetical protein